MYQSPARKNPPKQANPEQAVAVEPPMIAALEEKIQSLYEAEGPALEGLTVQLAGHLWCPAIPAHHACQASQSDPQLLSWLLHEGEARRPNRGGFSFSIPATFVNGLGLGLGLIQGLQQSGQG